MHLGLAEDQGNGRAALVGTLELFLEVAAAAVAHQTQVRQGVAQPLGKLETSLLCPLAHHGQIDIHRRADIGVELEGVEHQH